MDYSLLVGVLEIEEVTFKLQNSKPAEKDEDNLISYFTVNNGGMMASYETDENYPIIYYLGIIDILQEYNIKKKVENAFKRITDSQQEISCVDPATYAARFVNFIQ